MYGAVSDGFASLDATAQAELVRRGEITPLELVEASIARIERLNPELNAVIMPLFEKARAAAVSSRLSDGPFRGVPTLLKDLGAQSAGDPYHAGTRVLRDARWVAAVDSYLTAKLRAAGFIILGKTNTPELGLQPTTEPISYGPTRNPWGVGRSPGGSSGGAAAAVAVGMVAAAHATDGGGSIRIPASHCGLVGLKPTRGRVSLGPDVGERWGGCAVENSVTRSVRDAAAWLDTIAGPMPGDPNIAPPPPRPFAAEVGADPGRLRIGFTKRAPVGLEVHRECQTAVEETARLLETLGHVVEESYPEALRDVEAAGTFGMIVACSTARAIDVWEEKIGHPFAADSFEPMTWGLVELGRRYSARDYVRGVERLQQHSRLVANWWSEGFDVLLTPTTAEPPPRLGELGPRPDNPLAGWVRSVPFATFTSPYNITGQPAISLPLYWTKDGLPVGSQLVAAFGREDLLIRIAAQLEQARPWQGRRPSLW